MRVFHAKLIILLITLPLLAMMCSEDDSDGAPVGHTNAVIINQDLYQKSARDSYDLDSVWLDGDSLRFMVGYGGGCGGTKWSLLTDGSAVEKPGNPCMKVRLSFEDQDNCEAYISEIKSFSIVPIRSIGFRTLIINVENWEISFALHQTPDDGKYPHPAMSREPIVVNETLFNTAPNDDHAIDTVWFEAGRLNILARYGGGCGTVTWQLIASEEVMESFPVQVPIRLSLKDEDNCEAYLSSTLGYDLAPLISLRESKMILRLQGWPDPIFYEYKN